MVVTQNTDHVQEVTFVSVNQAITVKTAPRSVNADRTENAVMETAVAVCARVNHHIQVRHAKHTKQ